MKYIYCIPGLILLKKVFFLSLIFLQGMPAYMDHESRGDITKLMAPTAAPSFNFPPGNKTEDVPI